MPFVTDEPALDALLGALRDATPCDTAVILGSGWNTWVRSQEVICSVSYGDVLSESLFTQAAIPGHEGRVAVVRQGERQLLVFQGRFHLYQGLTAWQAALPVRLAHAMGCRQILLTNAVGGIAARLSPGDFVLIEDHLNFQGDNPLRGIQPSPFVNLNHLYQAGFYPELKQRLQPLGISLEKGVLAALLGPSYETPAEIRALAALGADVVSMSMVPEAIMACYLGLDVVGLSLVTNFAAGRSALPLNHDEVLACADQAQGHFVPLLDTLLSLWPPFVASSDSASV